MSDGRIVIDTELDSSGLESAISKLAGAFAIKELTEKVVQLGADFESTMSTVAAISGATGDEFEALTKKAKDMGAKTKFSANDCARAMTYMGMAGWKSGDMISGLDGILNLAAASGEDLGSVSDIVTDALTAFGLSASDSAHFADILAAASSNSNTNVGLLGESFKYVAPLMGAMGYSAEDCSTALGLMANAGLKGSQSGTSLKTALTNMLSPTDSMKAVMDEYGLSLTNADGSMKSLKEVMIMLREKMGGLDEATQGAAASTLFGKEAMSGMLSIINASEGDFEKLTGAIENCDGTALDMSNTMQDNVKGSFDELASALEGVALAIYDKFKGPLKDAIDKATEWISGFLEKFQNGDFDSIIQAVGAAIGVMAALAGAIKIVAIAQGILNAVMMMNPINWIILAIGVLIGALVYLWNTNDGFREAVTNAWNVIKDVAETVFGALKTFFTETIPNAIETMLTFFSELPGNIAKFLSDVINKVSTWASDMWNKAKETGQNFLNGVVDFIKNLPYNIGYLLGLAIGKAIQFGSDMWNKAKETGKNFVDGVINFVTNLPGNLANLLSTALSNVSSWASNMWSKAKETGSNFLSSIVEFFSQLPGRIWEWLSNTISKVGEFASNLGSKAREAGSNMVNNIIDAVVNLPSRMAEIGSNIVQGVWNGICGMGDWLYSQVTGFFSGIVDGVKDALGIQSPSRVFRDEVGRYMAQGVGVGFTNEEGNIQKDISSSLDDVIANVKTQVLFENARSIPTSAVSNSYFTTENIVQNDSETGLKEYVEQIANRPIKILIDGQEFIEATADNLEEFMIEKIRGR